MSDLPTTPDEADGIALTLTEVRDLTAEERRETVAGHPLPPDLGEVLSYLFFVNHRSAE